MVRITLFISNKLSFASQLCSYTVETIIAGCMQVPDLVPIPCKFCSNCWHSSVDWLETLMCCCLKFWNSHLNRLALLSFPHSFSGLPVHAERHLPHPFLLTCLTIQLELHGKYSPRTEVSSVVKFLTKYNWSIQMQYNSISYHSVINSLLLQYAAH